MLKRKKYLRMLLRFVLWTIGGIAVTLMLLIIALQFSDVQHFIVQKITSSISEKTGTRIDIGSVEIAFTHSVVIRDIFVESQTKDTLLCIKALSVDINLLGVLSQTIRVSNVRIDSMTAHIQRTLPDSAFNFDFILDAISTDSLPSPALPETSSSDQWNITVGGADIHNIEITYNDDVSGLNAHLYIGRLKLSIDTFDLANNRFHIDDASIEHTHVSLLQTKKSPEEESTPSDLDIGVGTVSLTQVRVTYENTISGERYAANVNSSHIVAEKISLPNHSIAIKSVQLDSSTFSVASKRIPENSKKQLSDSAGIDWVISLQRLQLKSNSVRYDIVNDSTIKGFDPSHIFMKSVSVDAEKIYFSAQQLSATVSHLSFVEQSGFTVLELSGKATLDSLHAALEHVFIQTPSSKIQQNIVLTYPSLFVLYNDIGNATVNVSVNESVISVSDILLFQPSLPLKNDSLGIMKTSLEMFGTVNDLHIKNFTVGMGESTSVDLSGTIRGLPDIKRANFEIDLRRFSSTRSELLGFVSDSLIPPGIVIPSLLSVSGKFNGTIDTFSASTVIETTIGTILTTAALHSMSDEDSTTAQWTAVVNIQEFDFGAFLNDTTTFGKASLIASFNGTGFTKDDISAKINIAADKIELNGYPYRRLTIDGIAGATMFQGKAEIQDSNIAFIFDGLINTGKKDPSYKFTFDLKGADLQRLHLMEDDIRIAGVITSNLTGEGMNDINGIVDVRKVVITKNGKRYLIDSLMYASVNTANETHISFASTIFAATFDGTTALGDLPYALKYHFNQYFSLHDTLLDRYTKPLAFSCRLMLHDPKTLTEVFLPQVSRLAAGIFEGNFDSEKKMLNVDVAVSTVNYDDIRIDSLAFAVRSDSARMSLVCNVKSISDSMLNITNLKISAAIEHDSIGLSLKSTDNEGSVKLLLAGIFNSVQNGYQFRFTPGGVIFRDSVWSVPADNALHFGNRQFIAHNILLQGVGQTLAIQSIEQSTPRPPLKIDFVNFQLGTLLQTVEQEKGLIGGVLNGNIVLRNLDKQMAFTSDLAIDGFTFRQILIGDIMLHANNQKQNLFEVNMDLSGNGNDISLNGTYLSKVGGSILDFDLDLKKMNLAGIEPFTFGQVKRLTGTAEGKMHLTGTLKHPSITGTVKFLNTAFEPDFLNSYLYIHNGGFDVDEHGIRLNAFVLKDTLGNTASLTGNLFTQDFREFEFDMRMQTKHFLLTHTPPAKNELFYGTLFLNSDITVQGDKAKPVIRIQAQLAKGTDLAVVVPESETAIQQRLDIVKFTVKKDSVDHILSRNKTGMEEVVDTSVTTLTGIDLTSNVEVDKQSRLRILIDPISGDSLVIRGEATFSVGLDPSGKLSVTGRYEIVEGTYQLSFGDFIKKEFSIEKGSSITWLGSATDAMFNITAVYIVKTSALDLVQDQLTGLSPEERNKYKQELRIMVHLIMDGKLLKPNIRFKLDLSPEQRGALGGAIYAKLNEINGQESELNKQVLALLVLGRFISASPLASTGEGGLTGFARSSASQVLTEQLNRLSEEYIRGVKLNVGVESFEDYSTGSAEGRTQLQLALSKQLFDDRVTVSVGGNVDLEGNKSKQNSLNNFAGDMNVGYKLTDDGRWQLQVFRQNRYEGAIEGDLVETGVGIVFTIDFDKLFGITLKAIEDDEE